MFTTQGGNVSAQVRPAKARSDMEYVRRTLPDFREKVAFLRRAQPASDRIRVTGTHAVTDPIVTVTMQQTSQLRIHIGLNSVNKIYSGNKIWTDSDFSNIRYSLSWKYFLQTYLQTG